MRYRRALIHGLQLKTSTVGKPISSTRPASRRPSSRVIVDQNGTPATYDLAVIGTTTSASPSSWAIHAVDCISPSDIDFARPPSPIRASRSCTPSTTTIQRTAWVSSRTRRRSNRTGCMAARPLHRQAEAWTWRHRPMVRSGAFRGSMTRSPMRKKHACWLDVYSRTSAVGRLQDRLAVWAEVDGPALLKRFCERLSNIGRLKSISCGGWHG